MARPKKTDTKTEEKTQEDSFGFNPNDFLNDYLKKTKTEHFNYEEAAEEYIVSSNSLILDSAVQLGAGCHRMIGVNGGGKTALSLTYMNNFLKYDKKRRRGIYIKAEGRLSKEMKQRSGITFIENGNKVDEWQDGTCFVFETRIYEVAADFIYQMIEKSAGGDVQYFFILDSVDGLIARNDIVKGFDESNKVAGGAVILSNLFKRIGIPLTKRGHIGIFISQVRAEVKIDPYDSQPKRVIASTGGNALLHAPDYILEFIPKYDGDNILEDETKKYDPIKNKIVGHFAKIKIQKASNENRGMIVKYPIRHKLDPISGHQVWNDKEIADILVAEEMMQAKGAWCSLSEDFYETVKKLVGEDFENKFNGRQKLLDFITSNKTYPKLRNQMIEYLKDMVKVKGSSFLHIEQSKEESEETDVMEG